MPQSDLILIYPQEISIDRVKYKFVKEIGVGSFGFVYEYVHEKLNKKLAVKIEKKDPKKRDTFGSSLISESYYMGQLSKLKPPLIHACKYYGDEKFNGNHMLKLEHVAYSIDEYIKLDPSLKKLSINDIMKQMLMAVQELHKNNLIH